MKRIIIELTDDEIWWARYGLLDPDLLADKVKDALAVLEREKGTRKLYIIDNAASKNCKNLSESYGEICVKCNKCGRYERSKE